VAGIWSERHVRRSLLPSTSFKHLNFLVSQPTTLRTRLQNIPTFFLTTASTYSHFSQTSIPPFSSPHPHHITTPSQSTAIVNMRSFVVYGVAALIASVAGQTGKTSSLPTPKTPTPNTPHSKHSSLQTLLTPNTPHSKHIKRLITNQLTVTVTVTETYCGAGMCPPIAARQEPSNAPGTINALSVLSSAYLSAIAAYTSAQATDSSLPSLTFVPELFSSYGLTDVGSTNALPSATAAPSESSIATSNPTDVENSQYSAATSPAPVSPSSPSAAPSSYGGVSTTTEETTVPASEAPSSGESTANPAQTSGTAAVPVPVPTAITDSSAISSYVSSVQSSLSSEASASPTAGETASPTDSATESPSATDSESAGTTEAPSSSASGESGSSSSEADAASATSATTTEAPPAQQTNNAAGTNQLPVAMGGLAVAVAGMLFI